jgi:hypothetical protein
MAAMLWISWYCSLICKHATNWNVCYFVALVELRGEHMNEAIYRMARANVQILLTYVLTCDTPETALHVA